MRHFTRQRIDGVMRRDWVALVNVIDSAELRIENTEDMQAALRFIRRDAEIEEPETIQLRHLQLALLIMRATQRRAERKGTTG